MASREQIIRLAQVPEAAHPLPPGMLDPWPPVPAIWVGISLTRAGRRKTPHYTLYVLGSEGEVLDYFDWESMEIALDQARAVAQVDRDVWRECRIDVAGNRVDVESFAICTAGYLASGADGATRRSSDAKGVGQALMSARDYATWAICGIAWHAVVILLVQWSFDQFVPGVFAGLAAGLVAGTMTVRSRVRRSGREHWGDLLLTYLVAVVVYATGLFATEIVVDVWIGRASHNLLDLFAGYLFYALLYALVWGALLVPLSFITRRIVWWVHGRGMLPN